MSKFPLVIEVAVLAILIMLVMLMAAFGWADRLIFASQLAFAASAGAAVLGVFLKHPLTEYAVWAMYVAGAVLAALMVWSFLRRKTLLHEFEESKQP